MTSMLTPHPLPIPAFFDPQKTGQIWKVPYETRARDAREWSRQHSIPPASASGFRIGLLGIDLQNTFCIPDFELFVGGPSGTGAVDDCRRLASFIYRNLANLTGITMTLDTHSPVQIFHAIYLIDEQGKHPDPMSSISAEDVASGRWKFNPAVAASLGITPEYGQAQLVDYTHKLQQMGKYDLTVWPYHAMLGGIGHAVVPAIEEAVFFHSIARSSQPDLILKGNEPLTESYSAVGPEVEQGPDGRILGRKSGRLLEKLGQYDAFIIAGEAKSHCVAWTIADLLQDILEEDPGLAARVYLLEDCTTPIAVPGVADYSEPADAAYARFAEAGMHRVLSTEPIESWPGIPVFVG